MPQNEPQPAPPGVPAVEETPPVNPAASEVTDPAPSVLRFRAGGAEVEFDLSREADRSKFVRYAEKGIGADRAIQQANERAQQAQQTLERLRAEMTDYDGYVTYKEFLTRPENAHWFREFNDALVRGYRGEPQAPRQPQYRTAPHASDDDDLDSYYGGEPSPQQQGGMNPEMGQLVQVLQQQQQMLQQLAQTVNGLQEAEKVRTQTSREQAAKAEADALQRRVLEGVAGSEMLARVPDQQYVVRQVIQALADLHGKTGSYDVDLAVDAIEQHYRKVWDVTRNSDWQTRRKDMQDFRTEPTEGSVPDTGTPPYEPRPEDLHTGVTLERVKEHLARKGYRF